MQEKGADGEMFTMMQSRWFYLSDKFLIGRHPISNRLVLVVRNGQSVPPMEVERVLQLNGMTLDGPMVTEQGIKYYDLSEKEVENGKAIDGGIPRSGESSDDQDGGRGLERSNT
jgi:hypothetical protein